MENRIKIVNINVKNKKTINIDYKILGEWKKFFNEQEKFFIEYDRSVEEVPDSIKIIPFLCNILPIAWVNHAIIELNCIDKEFYNCIEELRQAYKNMYPNIEMNCDIIDVKKIEDNSNIVKGKKAILFSGGVDSVSTLIEHINETPELITMCGADIKLEDYNGWEKVKKHTKNVATQYNLSYNYIKSNLKTFVNSKELDMEISKVINDNWWHGLQHGIGLLGQVSVIAYLKKITTIYIASSHTSSETGVKCASDPTIDNKLKFCSCQIIHDQYNLTRQEKINEIVEYSQKKQQYPNLRVCWEKDGGENCCRCEKCYRTIYGIIAGGGNPNQYGFTYNKKINKRARYDILYKINITKQRVVFWHDIKNILKTNSEILKKFPECSWICKQNFENIDSTWRKIRKTIGKLKRTLLGRK